MSFQARFASRCAECLEQIHVGDLIQAVDVGGVGRATRVVYAHVDCDAAVVETELDRDAKKPVCPRCFMVRPCECDDQERDYEH